MTPKPVEWAKMETLLVERDKDFLLEMRDCEVCNRAFGSSGMIQDGFIKTFVSYGPKGEGMYVFGFCCGQEIDLPEHRLTDGWLHIFHRRVEVINASLSPLLARAELLDRAVEAIKDLFYHGVEYEDRDHTGEPCVHKHEADFEAAESILTAYASLPKVPGQGEK